MRIEPALIDQEAVHNSVEIGIVRHVVDVTIDIVVHPPGLETHKMRIRISGFGLLIIHGMELSWI